MDVERWKLDVHLFLVRYCMLVFSFDVGRSMFDVGRSSFKPTLYGINKTCECLQNNLALMGSGSGEYKRSDGRSGETKKKNIEHPTSNFEWEKMNW